MLDVGDAVPSFSARTTDGREVSLGDFAGKYLVLYFYPKAFTPGCTREAQRFRDNYPEIRELGAEVLGVSVDDEQVQCRFAEAQKVTFPLVPDSKGELSRRFGVKRTMLPVARRVTYVIGPDAKIAARFIHEFQVNRHLDDVLGFLRKQSTAR